jgi:hypothetical protein
VKDVTFGALPTLMLLAAFGCNARKGDARAHKPPLASAPAVLAASAPEPTNLTSPQYRSCQEQLEKARREAALPGAPGLERQRATLLARAKAEPVFFVRTPEWLATSDPAVESFRKHFSNATHYWDVVKFQLQHFAMRPDIGGAVLLRDGYLYAEQPELAYALSENVRAEHVMKAPRIWIQRGERVFWAKRSLKGEYVYESGAGQGERVSLLHLDRVGTGELAPPLHVDLRSLEQRLSFDRIAVEHVSEQHLVANLKYAALNVPTLLARVGARLELVCELVPASATAELARVRRENARRYRALQFLRAAMRAQVAEQLSFDEPRREEGDEDGKLRTKWQTAYARGRHFYTHNDVLYDVFDRKGRPRPPQVCVDFVTDTLERASGTWWNARGKARERVVGKLDFGKFEGFTLRRVPDLVNFCEARPEWFEVYTNPESERIPLGQRQRFFEYMAANAERYQVGDIILIRGYTPNDPERMHYHSFFVFETDPITRVTIAVVGNAETPHIWTLESESRRTPRREIWQRIRIRTAFLEQYLPEDAVPPSEPAPLVEEPL